MLGVAVAMMGSSARYPLCASLRSLDFAAGRPKVVSEFRSAALGFTGVRVEGLGQFRVR